MSLNPFLSEPLTIHALFWECKFDHLNKNVDVLSKEQMGEVRIDVVETDKIETLIWKGIQKINIELLDRFLRAKELRQFIPAKTPSWDKQDGIMEICYYHNVNEYEQKWGNFNSDGFVMQPNDPHYLGEIQKLCRYYDLDPAHYI